jgi:RimJ/RimL family protein N-acetyltransferase
MKDIFAGKLVRLSGIDSTEFSKAFAAWDRDSEFKRLLQTNAAPLQSSNNINRWMEAEFENPSTGFYPFCIRTLADNKLVGGCDIEIVNWNGRNSFVAIFIGDRADWGKGYGTDAMNILLRYGFNELGLWRVSLGVFEYNPRAVRSYEKAGFQHEGRIRGGLNREGRRWDMLFMGILRDEWLKQNQ